MADLVAECAWHIQGQVSDRRLVLVIVDDLDLFAGVLALLLTPNLASGSRRP